MLDMLCLTGEVGWARLSAPAPTAGPPGSSPATPIALFLREHARRVAGAAPTASCRSRERPARRARAAGVLERAARRMARRSSASSRPRAALDADDVRARARRARRRRARQLRRLRRPARADRGRAAARPASATGARTSPAGGSRSPRTATARDRDAAVETLAWTLLRRYGVVFRRLLAREANARAVARARARLPAARGARRDPRRPVRVRHVGRAVRAARRGRAAARGAALGRPTAGSSTISAADPLNLTGIVTPGDASARRGATASSTATACRSPSWKVTSSASSRRSSRHRRRRVARARPPRVPAVIRK